MKKISISVQDLFSSLLAGALSLLGFSSCSQSGDMYGTPLSYYEIKGSVKSEDGDGVEGARVIMRPLYRDTPYSYTGTSDTVYTDSKGSYMIKSYTSAASDMRIRMVCQPLNTALEADSVEMKLKFEGGDHIWDFGTARETVDFTLKYKKILPEN